jgi:phosphate transport system substrate-binding protein
VTAFRKTLTRVSLAVAGAAFSCAAMAADITGAGATFPYPIYSKWADAYKKETGIGLNYQSIGSGGGIKQIKAKTVTFGATDKPLKAEELDAMEAIQWPMVMGGVVPVINVKGITPGQLVLDGKTLADIFQGRVSKWNDSAIAKLNPGVSLPAKAIAVVHRADGSGTTFNFTYYLGQVSESWRVNVGVEQSVEWPVGIGGKGNEGVANMVTQTDGAIGYVEYAYAKQNKMTFTKMINKDGKTVSPDADTFAAAAANADWAKAKGFYLILANQPGANSWPMTAATFIVMYKKADKSEDSLAALKFFDWAYKSGGKMADELDYVPMPAPVIDLVQKTWAANLKDASGAPLWK